MPSGFTLQSFVDYNKRIFVTIPNAAAKVFLYLYKTVAKSKTIRTKYNMTNIELISRKTYNEFQEHLVTTTLREITRYFDNYDVQFVSIPNELLPSGQRRSHVHQYYASINWGSSRDVKKILNVYSDILTDLSISTDTWSKDKLDRLTKYLPATPT